MFDETLAHRPQPMRLSLRDPYWSSQAEAGVHTLRAELVVREASEARLGSELEKTVAELGSLRAGALRQQQASEEFEVRLATERETARKVRLPWMVPRALTQDQSTLYPATARV